MNCQTAVSVLIALNFDTRRNNQKMIGINRPLMGLGSFDPKVMTCDGELRQSFGVTKECLMQLTNNDGRRNLYNF